MNVYIIKSQDHYKVGLANNVNRRLSALQTANPQKLEVVHYVRLESRGVAKKVESMMHTKFSANRVRGEWFSCEEKVLIEGLRECCLEYGIIHEKKKRKIRDAKEKIRKKRSLKTTELYNSIRNSTSGTVTIDRHSILCLLTGGMGASRKMRNLLGIPMPLKSGWKKKTFGMQVDRLEFLEACDDSLKK